VNWYSHVLFCVSKSMLGLEPSSLRGTVATKLLGPVFGRMGFIGDQTKLRNEVSRDPQHDPIRPLLQLSHLFRPRLRRSWIKHFASLLNDTDCEFPTKGCSGWLAFTGTTGLGSRLDQHPWLVEFILGWCSNYWRCLECETKDVQHVDAMLQNSYALTTWRALWCT